MSALSASSALSAVQAVVQAVLAALGPNQNQRLLRLHTPLGPNVLLAERLLGTETIGPRAPGVTPSAGFKFEVLALSTNAYLRLKDLIGQPVRVDLLTGQSLGALRPFHGHVTAFALLGSDGGLARYKLTIEPWLSVLAHRQDAWVFQDKTVMEILDEVFADYQAQGKLAPAWRWELADSSVYARRSLCIQYHESDLAFVQRLMAEEGLFCWFEHEASEGDTLGQHTLVIADHNGCFKPNVQPRVRYTQSASASFKEDSITRFDEARRVAPTVLSAASWDHRSVSQQAAEATGDESISVESLSLPLRDQPGAYAYETTSQAERLVRRHLEAVQAPAYRYQGEGALRLAACGTTFSLAEHPSVAAADQWVMLTVQHRARNNITADLSTSLQALLGKVPTAFGEASGETASRRAERPSLFRGPANQTTEPLYLARFFAQDASLPVRGMPCLSERGELTFARPKVVGTQTAIVVGLGEPVHTDRDGRIKIQFHWQRGAQSALRLDPPAGSNAPGDDSTGTWVRVAQPWAGGNWGGHFTPRLGQEVLVSFVEDDIDRPVVIGSAYNGAGSADAQGNRVAAGAGTATGNAAAWFPGTQTSGQFEGHQHPQVLAGFKSQSLDASASGTGGYNQLVFDDTPAQARTQLSSTTALSWLQIGHLLQQNDNQRLAKRGHGFDLGSAAYGAVRAGGGLHLSAYARPQGSQASAQPADARAALAQIEEGAELTRTLADTAQKHNAKLAGEADVEKLPSRLAYGRTQGSLSATDSRNDVEALKSDRDSSPEVRESEARTYDEQFVFVNANGALLKSLKYEVLLDDGTRHEGMTDERGRTQRIVTGSAQGVKEIRLTPSESQCCAAHAAQSGQSIEPLTFTPQQAVATNAVAVGSSTQQIATPKGAARPLTPGEIAMARQLFRDSVDYSKVKVHNGEYLWFGLQPDDTAMTPNGEMYFNRDYFQEDFSASTNFGDHLWFMHEMVHVWQYQLGYPVKLRGAFRIGLSYKYELAAGKTLADYNMEAQGNVLSDYWAEVLVGAPPALWQASSRGQSAMFKTVLASFIANPAGKTNLPGGS